MKIVILTAILPIHRFQAIPTNLRMIKSIMHLVIIHHMEREGSQIIMLTKMYQEYPTMIRTIKSIHTI
jgi:hypothetical protein